MMRNLALSEVVGLVPFLGDIFIAWWRANSRNAWLLEAFLTERAIQNLAIEGREILEEFEVDAEEPGRSSGIEEETADA